MTDDSFDFALPMLRTMQDFVPYNEAKFWDLSQEYYLGKGIAAWSDQAPKIIPHKSGSNYQNALNVTAILKILIERCSINTRRLKILECGAGSGRFSRHLLLAALDQGLLDSMELYVSDIAEKNLDEIKARNILSDIKEAKEGVHYHFVKLDVIQPLLDIKFDLIFMHFVYDALPLTILRKSADGKYEEQYVSMLLRKDINTSVLENDFLQARVHKELEWRPYDWSCQSPAEIEFQAQLENYAKSKQAGEEIFYIYSALKATQNLLKLLKPEGLLFSSDIRPGQEKSSLIVGNAIAHEVDNEFIASVFSDNYSVVLTDDKISRLLISPSQTVIDKLRPEFVRLYGEANNIQAYIELENQIESLIETCLRDGLANLLDQLKILSPYSARTYYLMSRYYELLGDQERSSRFALEAKSLDYWSDLE